jgi:hypothetical protein
LNHVWLTVLSDDNLKGKTGLKYISHMWDHQPYWYLWLEGLPGVFRLELHGAEPVEHYDWLAEFVIKYYPTEEEECFQGLSFMEKLCRRSEAFQNAPSPGGGGCACHGHLDGAEIRFSDLENGTGAPGIEHVGLIPPDFFYAGNLLLAFRENAGSSLTLKSQSLWQVTLVKDYPLRDPEGNAIAVLRQGEVDRSFPGYAISERLYRHLLRAWGGYHRYTREKEVIWKDGGISFLWDGENLKSRPSADIQRIVVRTEALPRTGGPLPPLTDQDIEEMKKIQTTGEV